MIGKGHSGRICAALGAAILVLSACGQAGPPPAIYVLGDPASAGRDFSVPLTSSVIEVKPVRVPEYLDTTDIVIRHPGGLIAPSQSARWGERLSVGLTRVVAASLRSRLPGIPVTTSAPLDPPLWQVLIDVDTFEAQSAGECVLIGRWSIRGGRGGERLKAEAFSLSEPVTGDSDAAVVAAMTHELARLADTIAPELVAEASRRGISTH
jgi:hypothetical protein